MSEQEKDKVKLTLRQIGNPNETDEITYEVIDTSCARFACKQKFSREEATSLCDENDVTIIYVHEDNRIAGFRNFIV